MKKTIFNFLSVIIFTTPLVAQEPAILESVTPGNRIRVSALEYFKKIKISRPSRKIARVVGTVVAANADTLFLRIDKQVEPLKVPLSSLKKIEVSRGKKSRAGKGALIGFLIGFATAEAFCAHIRYEDSGTMGANPWDCGLVIGGPAGGVIGAVMGAAINGGRWEEVPLNSALKTNQN